MAENGRYIRKKHHAAIVVVILALLAGLLFVGLPEAQTIVAELKVARLGQVQIPEWVDVQLIGIDGASRRGEQLEDVRDVVIHYVGNPGTTAQQNRDYYANPQSEVSSHFLVGLEGEIILCVPLDEKSSASNHRNRDTISIEVCHPDSSGKFTEESYQALVKLTAWLLDAARLDAGHVIRHYDITGKECPRYYVIHGDSWHTFLDDVARAAG